MDAEAWWNNMPIVTKTYMVAAIGTSVALTFDLVHPFQLYLNKTLIWENGEYWRLVTNFLFFGPMGVGLMFHLHFLYIYWRQLEEHFYFQRTGEFLFLLLIAALSLILLQPFVQALFLSEPLLVVVMYLWSRRFPDENIAFFGIIPFTSAYVPLVMTALSALFSGIESAKMDVVAMGVGHILWWLADVFPVITDWHPLRPSFVNSLLGRPREFIG